MFKVFPEFYRLQYRHPDLIPQNVYLREGRMADMNKAKKTIDNFGKTSFAERCSRIIKGVVERIAGYTEKTF